MRRFPTLLFGCMVVGLMLQGCQEQGQSEPPDADAEDTSSVEDSTDSQDIPEDSDAESTDGGVQAELDQWAEELPSDWTLITGEMHAEYDFSTAPEEGTDDAQLLWTVVSELTGLSPQGYEEELSKCLVAEDADGLIRIRCHPSIAWSDDDGFQDPGDRMVLNPCPTARYHVFNTAPAKSPASPWEYCLGEMSNQMLGMGDGCPQSSCPGFLVCEGMLRHVSASQYPTKHADCLGATECVKARESFPESTGPSCFYNDYTLAETGVIPEQDCESLHDGECAVNCPCTGEKQCEYISEAHPIGICGGDPCHQWESHGKDELCNYIQEGDSCMHLSSLPEWTVAYSDAPWMDTTEYDEETKTIEFDSMEYCVNTEACQVHAERYPGVFNCTIE